MGMTLNGSRMRGIEFRPTPRLTSRSNGAAETASSYH